MVRDTIDNGTYDSFVFAAKRRCLVRSLGSARLGNIVRHRAHVDAGEHCVRSAEDCFTVYHER